MESSKIFFFASIADCTDCFQTGVKVKINMLLLLATAAVLPPSALRGAESVLYPDNFRHWVHVGTGVIMPGSNPSFKSEEGMHHIFANENAVDGYASGHFAAGSIIVMSCAKPNRKWRHL